MDAQFQAELNAVIKKLRRLEAVPGMMKRDINEAAKIIVTAAKSNAPKSKKPHRARKVFVKPGNLKKSIRRLPLRRIKAAAIVGISRKAPTDGWYGSFVEKGTVSQTAQRFMERARESAGPQAQGVLIQVLKKRIEEYEKKYFR